MAYGMKVTDVGAAKIAAATVSGVPVVIESVVWGDADGTPYDPVGNETELVNLRHTTAIQEMVIDQQQANIIRVKGLIQTAPVNFTLHEVGLVDEDGDLIAIGKHPPQVIPSSEDTWSLNYEPTFLLSVSNTGSVTVNITPESDFLTKAEADTYYDPLGSGVQQVHEGWAINVTGTIAHPVVAVDPDTLDARYRGINDPFPFPAHRHDNVTQTVDGFMSKEDKIKLDGINILGGTALFNKVASAKVTTPVAVVDLLNISGATAYLLVAHGITVSSNPATAGLLMRTGNGASVYSGSSDYKSYPSGDANAFPYEAYSITGLLDMGLLNPGGSPIQAGGVLFAYLVNLNANSPTYLVGRAAGADDNFLDIGVERRFNVGLGAAPISTASRVENRIRFLLNDGANFTAGTFNLYAVGA